MRGIGAGARAYARAWTFGTPRAVRPAERYHFVDDGKIPNSPLPTFIYRAVPLRGDKANALERLFAEHGWPPRWRATVYDFHHYHANTHEVVGVAAGSARLLLGGESGQRVTVHAGDVVVLPAGTGHCRLESSPDFLVVGAYPEGTGDYDLLRADPAVHEAALRRIAEVPVPKADPVVGRGGVVTCWFRICHRC